MALVLWARETGGHERFHIYTYIYIYVHMYVSVSIHVNMHVCISAYMYICVSCLTSALFAGACCMAVGYLAGKHSCCPVGRQCQRSHHNGFRSRLIDWARQCWIANDVNDTLIDLTFEVHESF